MQKSRSFLLQPALTLLTHMAPSGHLLKAGEGSGWPGVQLPALPGTAWPPKGSTTVKLLLLLGAFLSMMLYWWEMLLFAGEKLTGAGDVLWWKAAAQGNPTCTHMHC